MNPHFIINEMTVRLLAEYVDEVLYDFDCEQPLTDESFESFIKHVRAIASELSRLVSIYLDQKYLHEHLESTQAERLELKSKLNIDFDSKT